MKYLLAVWIITALVAEARADREESITAWKRVGCDIQHLDSGTKTTCSVIKSEMNSHVWRILQDDCIEGSDRDIHIPGVSRGTVEQCMSLSGYGD